MPVTGVKDRPMPGLSKMQENYARKIKALGRKLGFKVKDDTEK